jgi:hypothetical protein
MTTEEIIEMAREAGFARWHKDLKRWIYEPGLERFAALVAAKEREACAQVCRAKAGTDSYDYSTAIYLADEISARGAA